MTTKIKASNIDNGAVTADKLHTTAITDKLGYTPVSPTTLSSSGLATETYVNTQITNLIDSAPTALNTLNELAAALGDDANYASTITTALGTKANQSTTYTKTEVDTAISNVPMPSLSSLGISNHNLITVDGSGNTTLGGTKVKFPGASADPSTGLVAGQIYYNTTDNVLRYYNGTKWGKLSPPLAFYGSNADAVADGVISYFPCRNTSDTTAVIGSGTATLYNVSQTTNAATSGNAWDRGTSSANGIILSGMTTSTTHTLSFWMNVTDDTIHSTGDGAGIFWPNTSDGAGVQWGYDGGSPRTLRFGGSGWVSDGTDTGIRISTNTWYHLLYTRSGTSWVAYVNGSQVTTRSESWAYGTNWSFANYSTLVNGNGNNHYMRGIIDEIVVWNRALTSLEVATLYQKYTGKYGLTDTLGAA